MTAKPARHVIIRKQAEDGLRYLEALEILAGFGPDWASESVRADREWLHHATSHELKSLTLVVREIERRCQEIKADGGLKATPNQAIDLYSKLLAKWPQIVSKSEALEVYTPCAFKRFDVGAIPSYARINIPDRTVDLPERNFYRDSRCLYLLAQELYDSLPLPGGGPPTGTVTALHDSYEEIGRRRAPYLLRYAIEGLCRSAIVASYACVEAFVSGLGIDYADHTKGLTAEADRELRTGQDKPGRYMALPRKMQRFVKLITGGDLPLQVTDEKQRPEPFRSFFERVEGFRHDVAHPSAYKNLRLITSEYLERAKEALDLSEAVVRQLRELLRGHRQGQDDYIFWLLKAEERQRPQHYASLIRLYLTSSSPRTPSEVLSEIGGGSLPGVPAPDPGRAER